MQGHDQSVRDTLLSRAETLSHENASFSRFLNAVISASAAEDLTSLSPDRVEAILQRTFGHVIGYDGETSKIVLSPPETANDPLVIDVISPDMPFIVDSALAAVRAAGGTIRLFAHPVVHLDQQEIVAEGGRALSVLHIHSDPVGDLGGLDAELQATMKDVGCAVADWQPMLERVRAAAIELSQTPAKNRDEAVLFLDWLAENNFTFLGLRQYRLTDGALQPLPETGRGIMREALVKVLRSGAEFIESTPAHTDFMASSEPLLITKANIRARVHRRQHLDYVGVKLYDAQGKADGELRIVGLFTSQAMATPHSEVPIIRRKLGEVMRRASVDPLGHDGRALLSALDTYPRDELFQVDAGQLFEFANAIAGLYDRPRVRVLPRIDRFDNFVSILVYVPRDRYDGQARARITQYLAQRYDGRISAYYPHFPEGDLVRLHVIIGRVAGPTPQPSRAELEARIEELTASFGDMVVAAAPDPAAVSDYRNAFSQAYQSRNDAAAALKDIAVLQTLNDGSHIAIRLHNRTGGDGALGLKFYHHGSAIPLSDRVPMLEAFGFRIIDERTDTLTPRDGTERYIHDLVLERADGKAFDMAELGPSVDAGLLAVWEGRAESDGLNALVLTAGLSWQDAALLRALSRYLRQIGISYSQRYIAQVLVTQSRAAAALIRLFDARLNPAQTGNAEAAREDIAAALDSMASLDEDTIIRRFLNLVETALRTNAWQRDADGDTRPALAIKFDCAKVEGMAAPRPYREIFVYSPRVEGVHLRFGAIARGGIRWSDRPEDFRTEVLGLVKAQQVKNAVIVPVGAKGGFVPKHLVTGMAREAFAAEGVASYKIFIGALLDITDNRVGHDVVPPKDTICIDANDPYLVVAADKGTASFSDIANSIAVERDYWLGDAFASGGSAGYDHKEMGITARGGWEAVKRHFRELDRDIQKTPVTVVGVGDMSGDVFGNGMLLSPEIRLMAAFDHRDIFIDPNPDAVTSLAERHRLFELPRSSWQDYKAPISDGGGVFSRSLKAIPLSPQMGSLLGLTGAHATPTEVISAILKADVDLLWFGGIGTYVRASTEANAGVGDRANDAVRIAANQLRAKVVGEGANLGTTQLARIEYALAGGRINTDAIDNSAGVNSSDLEVNIKIALQPLLADGSITLPQRNTFLASMTQEVAALCLRNNYLQPLALSLAQRAGLADLPDHREMIAQLEARGLLDRGVEFLPSDSALDSRAANGQALARPELAVLLAYAKLTLYADLLEDDALGEDYLAGELFRYFPQTLHTTYPHAVETHRLRREVIATVLANAMINRGGPGYVSELTSATSASAGEIALAYAATRDIYGLTALNGALDELDGAVSGAVQLSLYAAVEALLRQETLWFLRNADVTKGIGALVQRHAEAVATLKTLFASALPAPLATAVGNKAAALVNQKVPAPVAQHIAELGVLSFASDIALIGERNSVPVADAAKAFFAVLAEFSLWPVIEQGRTLVLSDRFERMALDRALANLLRAQRDLTTDVLAAGTGSIADRVTTWKAHAAGVDRAAQAVAELTQGTLTVSRLSVAAGLLADLAQAS